MAKIKLLIDTDVFINYLNVRTAKDIFKNYGYKIYYSLVTKKELLSKPGLKESERRAILSLLNQYQLIPLDSKITALYSKIRSDYPSLEKEDALIAASALQKKLPLVTGNWKHFKVIKNLNVVRIHSH